MTAANKQKILEKISVDQDTGCWNWIGSIVSNKHPRIYLSGKTCQAKRVSFEAFIGEIFDEKIAVKNTCDSVMCVNPDHLRLATQAETMKLVGKKKVLYNKCKRGHSLSDARIGANGQRFCRECARYHNTIRKESYISKSKKLWTHCKHGHSLHDAYIKKGGRRDCRTCNRIRRKVSYDKKINNNIRVSERR